ncbi:MAG: ABC transporter ATP-binding protein [Candidatus Omnitrophica bacterium]|nr:ABC transporter ATP-binding protein [Candidatus Omnitrophota bacterium]
MGLAGANGSGKTTLLKILATLVTPNTGTGHINGYGLKEGFKIRSSVGIALLGERSFYWRLTGRENLEFFAALQNIAVPKIKHRINEVLTIVGLKNISNLWYGNYSSGMKQRLNIARALLHNPDILLLDEPTRNLDAKGTSEIFRFIKKNIVESHRKSVLIATNRLKEIREVCDKALLLDKGKMIGFGDCTEIANKLSILEL